MNKLRYRLVYNTLRGQYMVVAETARASGKGAGAGESPAPALDAHPALRRLARALAVAFCGSMLCAGASALAQVIADPNAAAAQRATVLNAANGVIQVNIQTPSSAGVSRNTYTQFDVPKGGVILNNARTDTQTQLGGYVQANPWLAQGQARVILNEVNSSSPSRLQGFIEVAGQRAEVIVANPSGIAVDGGGFINVSRATLTTGSARMTDGRLDGFTVARGRITIDGAGLDASKTDYTALIARSVAVNAAIWAQQLNVTAGAGDVPVTGDSIAAKPAQEAAPTYAIDVAQMGGMYANKIFLVGSDAGVGVRNAGNVGAAAGELIVTADGRIENTGALSASAQLSVTGRAIANSGTIRSAATVQLAAQGDIDNSGGTIGAARLDLGSASGSLVNAGGVITQGGGIGLDLSSATLRNTGGGQVGAPAPAAAAGVAVTDTGAAIASGTAAAATTPAAAASTAPALPNGVIHAALAIDNSAGQIDAGGVITLATGAIDNSGGKLYLRDLIFNGNAFVNRAGAVAVAGQFSAVTPVFDNTGGSIVAGGAFDASTGAFTNTAGTVRAQGIRIGAAGGFANDGGTVDSGAALTLAAADFSNRGGIVLAQGQSALTFTGRADNTGGAIQASGALAFTAGGLFDNTGGAIDGLGAGSTYAVRAGTIANTGGRLANNGTGATTIAATGTFSNSGAVSAGGALTLQAATLSNAEGMITSAAGLALDVTGNLDNSGTISSAGNLALDHAGATLHNSGTLVAGGALRVQVASLVNDGGALATVAGSGGALAVDAGAISNRGGAILADGGAAIASAGGFDNTGGLVQGAHDMALDVAGAMQNQGGAVEALSATSQLAVRAGSLASDGGRIVNAGTGSTLVHSAGSLQNGGLIQGAGTLAVDAVTMQQLAAGQLLSGASMALAVSQQFDNAGAIGSHGQLSIDGGNIHNGGQVVAAGPVTVHAAQFSNDGGQLATSAGTGGSVTIAATAVSNRGGSMIADGAIDASAAGALDNTGGTIQSARDLHLAAGGTVTNDTGTIAAAGAHGNLQVSAAALTNLGGRIVNAAGDAESGIAVTGSLVNSGLIASTGALALQAGLLNNDGGQIATTTGAGGAIAITAASLQNRGGSILADATARMTVAGQFDNNSGQVQAGAALVLDAGAVDNTQGAIGTLAGGTTLALHAAALDNDGGRIANAGSGATTIASAGALFNSGTIQAAGALDLSAQALQTSAAGKTVAGGAMRITAGQQFDNAGIFSSQGDLRLDGAGATVANHGQIVSSGAATIVAARLDNDGGQIATASGSGASLAITAATLSNAGGTLLADRDATVAVAGTVDNSGGTIQAANALQLTAGGALNNTAGAIEAGGAATAMQVAAGSIDNTAGRIVNTGTGTTAITAATTLASSGVIAGNGALVLEAASMENRVGATLSSGAALDVNVTQRFANLGGSVSSAGALTFNQAGAAFVNSGAIVAGAGASVTAASIDNSGGQLVTVKGSGAAIDLHAASMANRGGVILADGGAALASSGGFDNTGGVVQAGASLALAAGGTFANDAGAIEALGASAALSVNAAALANGTGRISNLGAGATTVSSQGAIVNNGLIAGNGNVTVTAATLQNQALGAIGSAGNLDLNVAQQVDNQGSVSSAGTLTFNQAGAGLANRGNIASNGAMTIHVAAIDNNGGVLSTVRGAGGAIDLAGALSNRVGFVLADGDATFNLGGAFDNTQGTLQAGRNLWLATPGLLTNSGGTIEALGAGSTLTLQAAALDNTGGRIVNLGSGATRVAAGGAIVNGGTIGGNGSVFLSSQSLTNLTGATVSSGAGLDLGVSQLLVNQGAIDSAGTLSFNQGAAQLVNSGQISAGGNALVNVATIDNRGGQISTGAGSGADLTVAAQAIANDGGRIVADRDLVLAAGQLTGGVVGAGRDLTATLQGDFVNGNGAAQFSSQRDLTLSISGNFTNTGAFTAVRDLALSANNVANLAGATIAAQDVTLRPAGSLTNAGEINATGVLDIAAGGNIDNSGAIVGASLALAAQNIANDGAQALLGATAAMQLTAAGEIDNRGNATIYSAGWLAAQAATVNNLSSTIESGGDMAMVAGTINNIRENVQIVQTVVTDETVHMTLPSWYTHGDNNNEYDPRSSNYHPYQSFFVNPADVISDTTIVTPDGNTIGRLVYTSHASDSAFFAANSGQFGKYGDRQRITATDGTRTIYYTVKENDVANPDQGGASVNGNPLFGSDTMIWDGPEVTYSNQYGSCSTTCVRYTTQPSYDDPTHTIDLNTIRQLAGSKDRLEIYRDAHHVAVEDSLAAGAGAVARIVAGGNMQLTVSQLLNNQYSDVMATGFLAIDGAGAKVNQGATLYRNNTFDGSWTTENHTVTAYTMPSIAEVIGVVGGVMSGGQGVSITGGSFTNVDVTAGSVGIVRTDVHVLGSGATGATGAGGGATGSGVGNQAGLQGGFSGPGASAASTAALSGFQATAGAVATTGPGSGLAAAGLQGAQSANRTGLAATSVAVALAATGGAGKPGANTVLAVAPSGLFIKNPDANGQFLFETRSQFANLADWASSDYLFRALGIAPDATQKRLGDGFYEQQLVRQQLDQLTGRAPANGASDDSVYQSLLVNAVSFAEAYGLRPGIALTADQVSHLTSDIVWMESQQVSLPDGSIQTVLVPKVYLAHLGTDAISAGGALVTGAGVSINTTGDIVNRGGVIDGGAGRTLLVSGNDILNQGGTIAGGDVLLAAARDVRNESLASTQTYASATTSGSYTTLSSQAVIKATGVLEIDAGRDITDVAGHISAASASLTATRDIAFNALATGSTYTAQVGQDAQADSTVGHALSQMTTTGNLVVAAGRDLTLSGAQLNIGGDGALLAGRALTVASVMDEVKTDQHGDASAKQYDKRAADNQTVVGSSVGAGGALQLSAGLTETAALTVSSSALAAGGALALGATGDVNIGGVQEVHVRDDASHHEASSTFKSLSTTTADYTAVSNFIGSNVSGSAVSINSGNNLNIVGSGVVADGNVDLVAKGSIAITAGTSTRTESHHTEVVEGGFLSGGGGFGITYGTRTTTNDQNSDATLQSGQSRSMVGSLGGNLTVSAGNRIDIAGSEVIAANDMTLVGKTVAITPGQDQVDGTSAYKRSQDGFTLAVGGTVVDAVQTVKTMGSAAGATGNSRMKALAAATAAKAAADALKAVAKDGASVSISLTAGHSENEQTQSTASTAHAGSTLSAGNDLTIVATGGGAASNIDIIGSDVSAKHNVTLIADNQVNLLAAQDKDSQHSASKSLSGAVGVAASISTNGGVAFGLTASAAVGSGTEDGTGVTQLNSHVAAGGQFAIISGGDTNIKGAVASGNQVVANVGGNLNIESLQDTATFDSKSKSASVSAIVGYGASVSATLSASNSSSDYASVQEQSGVRAGDGGFQINVAGNTDLKGALLASSKGATDALANSLSTGTLTVSDIQNHSTASASQIGVAGSANLAGSPAPSDSDKTAAGSGIKMQDAGKGPNITDNFYEASKAILGTYLASGTDSANSSGSTRTAVSGGVVNITDVDKQIQMTGMDALATVASLNRTVEGANAVVAEENAAALAEQLHAKSAIETAAFQTATVYTDQAHAAMFDVGVDYYSIKCSGQSVDCISDPKKLVSSPINQQQAVEDGAVLAVNGIMNNSTRAAELAYQNAPVSAGNEKPDSIVLMYIKPAETDTAEILVAAYEKLMAPTFGYTIADYAYADLIQARAGTVTLSLGHSRGTIVQVNAFDILSARGVEENQLSVLGVGGAVLASTYYSSARAVSKNSLGDSGAIQYAYMSNDPIPVLGGFNFLSGPSDILSSIIEFKNVYDNGYSAHSCYGTGAKGCVTVAHPVPGGPASSVKSTSSIIIFENNNLISPNASK